jgi:autotransporter adhesin
MKHKTLNPRRALRLSAISAALWLAAIQSPAALAGDICANDVNGSGNGSTANGQTAFSCGQSNEANGVGSTAVGLRNRANGFVSSAFGYYGSAVGARSLVFSGWYDRDGDGELTYDLDLDGNNDNEASTEAAYATGISAVALGAGVVARGDWSTVVGVNNTALGDGDAALGTGNSAGMTDFLSLSANNAAVGVDNTATGGFAPFFLSSKTSSAAVGAGNQATGGNSSALGVENIASGINSTAIGYSSVASADDSTAIGSNSVADRENTLSVGAAGFERQIVNVANASEDTDAVNLSQLYPFATALGGGASYIGGIFTAPTYVIQSNNFNDIGSAFSAVDSELTDINQRISNAGGIQGERGLSAYEVAVSNGFAGTEGDWLQSLNGAQGPAGPTGPEGPAGGGPRSVTYDSDTRDVLTMAGADGTRIANVADAVEATDAVNLGQMESGDAETLSAANEYTDNTATETLTSANAYTDQRFAELTGLSDDFEAFRGQVDQRFNQQDRRIDRQGAMSSAMLNMATSTAGIRTRNRVGVGVGFQGGERALSVGYQRAVSERAAVTIGGAFSGKEKSAGVGVGFGW